MMMNCEPYKTCKRVIIRNKERRMNFIEVYDIYSYLKVSKVK